MQKQLEAVKQFHDVFKISYTANLCNDLGDNNTNLRYNLMTEENDEYLEAAKNKDIVAIADALGDMLYILCGTILQHGLQHKIEAVFDEIQQSNMSKLGTDGEPIYREDGKVIKGPNYSKPELKNILI